MTDVTPGLLEKIQNEFTKGIEQSGTLKRIEGLLIKGTATHADSLEYASEIGDILKKALANNLTAGTLPDGRMYYNIAKRILESTLTREHHLVANLSAKVQELLNQNAGLGLKGLKPPPDLDRIQGIVNRVAVEEDFEKVKWILGEPVKNYAQNVVDETVRINADFHSKAGLKATITRRRVGSCCDWCKNLEGVYEYEEVSEKGNPVFMRHEHCDCQVVYDPGDGRKINTHTKRESGSAEDLAAQKRLAEKKAERRAKK